MKRGRKVEIKLSERRLALLAIPFLIFSLLALATVFADDNIEAAVSVAPVAHIECKPDVLTVGSSEQWINCFIELDNADIHQIDISTVKLQVGSSLGYVLADQSPSGHSFGDFDHDGKPDLQVRFSRSAADSLGLSNVGTFTLTVTGVVNIFSFSDSDSILVVSQCSNNKVHVFQVNSSENKLATINTLDEINLQQYSQIASRFSGFFLCKDNKLLADAAFYGEGTINVPKTIHFFLFDIPIIEKQLVKITGMFTNFDDCFADSTTAHCSGPGKLVMWNEKTRTTTRFDLPTMRFDVADNKAKVEGGNFFNDLLSVENIKITKIRIS